MQGILIASQHVFLRTSANIARWAPLQLREVIWPWIDRILTLIYAILCRKCHLYIVNSHRINWLVLNPKPEAHLLITICTSRLRQEDYFGVAPWTYVEENSTKRFWLKVTAPLWAATQLTPSKPCCFRNLPKQQHGLIINIQRHGRLSNTMFRVGGVKKNHVWTM